MAERIYGKFQWAGVPVATTGKSQVNQDGTNAYALLVSSSAASLPAGTDRSGSITAGGTAQQLAAANSSRTFLTGQNTSAGDLWINEIGGTAAVSTVGSYKVISGSSFRISTNRAISIIGATTGQQFAATEG